MMVDKRLLNIVKESRIYIVGNVVCQWISLIANIVLMSAISLFLQDIYQKELQTQQFLKICGISCFAVAVRGCCFLLSSKMSYLSSKSVKRILREKIYGKLLKLGSSYREKVKTSEVIQVAVEGVEQLETYFGAYLPQLFYAMVAPLTLFIFLCFIHIPSAILLFVCVPLIPVTIVMVQKWAKKLLGNYWNQYTTLGDTFLENLQGLTTTKIYQSDGYKQEEMKEQSERFRKITMRVLTMQLNSITVMDLIAYGGAGLGIILAATQFRSGRISLMGCLLIILLAADFFLPMRMLGSFFHIAMNGMAASDKIFKLLELPEEEEKTEKMVRNGAIEIRNMNFGYSSDKMILENISMQFPRESFTAIVGESGCGKSTLASILMGRNKNYTGQIKIGEMDFSKINEESLMEEITYIGHQSYVFKGSVRENLIMASPDASDDLLWEVLERVHLSEFLKAENGLDTMLKEKASNLSGGQRQRLALARALLHDSAIYIFDEATSNIDVESENDIMEQIYQLAKTKTVLLISHRLANVVNANWIYVLEDGKLVEEGTHESLRKNQGSYEKLWNTQYELERFTKGGNLK